MKKLSINSVDKRITIEYRSLLAGLVTIVFCSEMTIYARDSQVFESVLNAVMFLCIICGVLDCCKRHRSKDKVVIVLTIAFFSARLVSYLINGKTVTYGGAMMDQAFYLIGIYTGLFGGRQQRNVALCSFLIFDVFIIMLCYFNYYLRYDYVVSIVSKYWEGGLDFKTNAFQNQNYAGMLTGAAIIICCALLLNAGLSRKRIAALSPILVLNIYTLIRYTNCRSAQTGLAITAAIFIAVLVAKRLDSVKLVATMLLVACVATLIPLYTLVYYKDNENYLADVTPMERFLDSALTDRYAIWKTTIISQEGHGLFGYANSSNAKEKREELVNTFDQTKVADNYRMALEHSRQHNGYLATINEAGFLGAGILLLLLLKRIASLKGRFSDKQWEYLMLPYIFWTNIFEAKLINALFFTGFLMMILLLPSENTEIEAQR